MAKPKRKPRPSMPHWWWLGMDGCWFCDTLNNCSQCKPARASGKYKYDRILNRKDRQQMERENNEAD